MDLRVYYQKIRETESNIPDPFVVVMSRDTPDGGKRGSLTEVPRRVAAKMIVDGTAFIADAQVTKKFLEEMAAAKKKADDEAAAARVQLTLVSPKELQQLRGKV